MGLTYRASIRSAIVFDQPLNLQHAAVLRQFILFPWTQFGGSSRGGSLEKLYNVIKVTKTKISIIQYNARAMWPDIKTGQGDL